MSACKGSQFKETVGHRLAFFAHHRSVGKASDSSGAGHLLSGSDAITAKFGLTKERIASQSSPVTMDELKPLHVFNWLLSPAQQQEHTKWVATLFGALSSSSSSAVGAKRSKRAGESSSDKNSSDKKSKVEPSVVVDDLFS